MKADESFVKAELQLAQRIQEIVDFDYLRQLSDSANQAAKQISEVSQIIGTINYCDPPESVVASINASVSAIAQAGCQLIFPENVYSSIILFQANEIAKIDEMVPTTMLKELQHQLAVSNFPAYISSISEALKSTLIDAADISYLKGIKTHEFGTQIINTINMPRGLKAKLDGLHVLTANRLAKNEEISFNLQTNQFLLNEEPEMTSTVEEMNALSSAADMFDSLADEKEYISEEELISFMNLLQSAQSHASECSTGRKIDSLIRDVVDRINFDRKSFYHGRTMADENACPYLNAQMLTAPVGLPVTGRFNNPGRPYYYFADTVDGTITELRKHERKKRIQIAEIEPIKNAVIIDLSGTLRNAKTFLKYIRFQLDDLSAMPRVYLIPNYVSDCCRMHGIEGIKYYGSKEYSNYVTWNAGYFRHVRTIFEPDIV